MRRSRYDVQALLEARRAAHIAEDMASYKDNERHDCGLSHAPILWKRSLEERGFMLSRGVKFSCWAGGKRSKSRALSLRRCLLLLVKIACIVPPSPCYPISVHIEGKRSSLTRAVPSKGTPQRCSRRSAAARCDLLERYWESP